MNDPNQFARYLNVAPQGASQAGHGRGDVRHDGAGMANQTFAPTSMGVQNTGAFQMPRNMSGQAPSMNYGPPQGMVAPQGSNLGGGMPARDFGARGMGGGYESNAANPAFQGYLGGGRQPGQGGSGGMTRDQWRGRNQNQNFNSRFGMPNPGGLTPNRQADAATNQYFLARQQYLGGR